MYCQYCGTEIPDGSRFCNNCGASVILNGSINPQQNNQNIYQPNVTDNSSAPPPTPPAVSVTNSVTNKSKGCGCSTFLIIGLVLFVLFLIRPFGSRNTSTGSSSPAAKDKEPVAVTDTTSESTDQTTEKDKLEQEPESKQSDAFVVAENPQNMKIGEIGKNDPYYFGLCCVRSLDYIQTALPDYTEEIPSDKEVIYALVEIYNDSWDIQHYYRDDLSVYCDGVKAPEPDTALLVGIDGYNLFNSYEMDPETRALYVYACVVDKDWKELSVFAGDLCWKVSPEDISSTPYEYTSLYDIYVPDSLTDKGGVITTDKYTLTYDDFEIYTHQNAAFGNQLYAIFKFTIENTTSTALDYKMVGYNMRGYQNLTLLDGADYTMDDSIGNYINVYEVEEIKPGMTAKIYVPFEIRNSDGVFSCVYDTGYLDNEVVAIVNAAVESAEESE